MLDIRHRPIPILPKDVAGYEGFAQAARQAPQLDFDGLIQRTLAYAEAHLPGVEISFGGDDGKVLLVYARREDKELAHAVTLPDLLQPLGKHKLQDVILDFQQRMLPQEQWTDGRPR